MKILAQDEVTSTIILMTDKFQYAMKGFESNKSEFDALVKEFTLVKDILANHAINVEDVSAKLRALVSVVEQKVSNITQRIEQIHSKVDVNKDLHNELSVKVGESVAQVNSRLSATSSQLNALSANAASKDDLATLTATFNKRIDGLLEYIKKLEEVATKQMVSVDAAHSKIGQTNSTIVDIQSNVSSLNNSTISLQSSIDKLVNDFNMKLSSEVVKLRVDVDSRIIAAKNELAALGTPCDALRTELIKKIDDMSLDGRNAVLKASVSSQQITIIEKKIENIYLLLKKFDLAQG